VIVNKLKVLVVEDSPIEMLIITTALDSAKIDYVAVSNSADAMEAAITHKPGIALLDMNMPGIDGRELCELLQTNPLTSHIKVVFLTASESVDDILYGVNVHAAAYCIKGISAHELLNHIISIDFATGLRAEVNQFQQFNKHLVNKYEKICSIH